MRGREAGERKIMQRNVKMIYNEAEQSDVLLSGVNDLGSLGAIFVLTVFVVIPELIKYFQ